MTLFDRRRAPQADAARYVAPQAAGSGRIVQGGGNRSAMRLLVAGLTGLAGLALIGYVLFQPAGSDEAFGWEPVTEEARLAVEQAAAPPSAPVPSQASSSEAKAAATATNHPALSAGSSPAPVPSGVSPSKADPGPSSGSLLDLNRASAAELDGLPGIGPAKAQAIVAYRERYGAFRTVDQLLEVKGIGPKLLERLRPLVTVGAAGEEPSAEPESNGR